MRGGFGGGVLAGVGGRGSLSGIRPKDSPKLLYFYTIKHPFLTD